MLNNDYELTCEDIQDLSSRNALYDVAIGERLKDRICFETGSVLRFSHISRAASFSMHNVPANCRHA